MHSPRLLIESWQGPLLASGRCAVARSRGVAARLAPVTGDLARGGVTPPRRPCERLKVHHPVDYLVHLPVNHTALDRGLDDVSGGDTVDSHAGPPAEPLTRT